MAAKPNKDISKLPVWAREEIQILRRQLANEKRLVSLLKNRGGRSDRYFTRDTMLGGWHPLHENTYDLKIVCPVGEFSVSYIEHEKCIRVSSLDKNVLTLVPRACNCVAIVSSKE